MTSAALDGDDKEGQEGDRGEEDGGDADADAAEEEGEGEVDMTDLPPELRMDEYDDDDDDDEPDLVMNNDDDMDEDHVQVQHGRPDLT